MSDSAKFCPDFHMLREITVQGKLEGEDKGGRRLTVLTMTIFLMLS
jgi:hypothetical protein